MALSVEQAKKAHSIRQQFIYKLAYKDLNFKQFCIAAKTEEYKTLRSLLIVNIMKKFPSWTEETTQHAFIAYGLPLNLTVKMCMKNENYFRTVTILMESSSNKWQKRIKAPDGFPWNGNILKVLNDINDIKLPREISEATRYYPKEEYDTNNRIDDNLNAIFNEEDRDEYNSLSNTNSSPLEGNDDIYSMINNSLNDNKDNNDDYEDNDLEALLNSDDDDNEEDDGFIDFI